jgi:phage terminase large subunit-like protein
MDSSKIADLIATPEGRRALSIASPIFFDSYYLGMQAAKHRSKWLSKIETLQEQSRDNNTKGKLLVLSSRGHGKSLLAISYCVRQICMNRNTSILFISASAGQAEKRVRLIKQFLESKKIKEDWGDGEEMPSFKGPESKWTSTQLYVQRNGSSVDPTLEAIGSGGKITGAHCDIVVIDDLEDDLTTSSESVRAKTRDWLAATVTPILNQGGMMLVIGTRKHYFDVYHYMKQDPTFQVIEDAAIKKWPDSYEYITEEDEYGIETLKEVKVTGDYEVLWPEFRPIEFLLMERRSMGSHLFAREMQNQVQSEDDAIIKRDWVDAAKVSSYDFNNPPPINLQECIVIQSWDLSIESDVTKAKQKDTDYTCGWTLARDKNGKIWALDMFHTRGISQQEIMNAIVSMYTKWKEYVKEIWVEKNSFGALYVQQLQQTSLPVKPVIMSAKNALRNSIHNIAILFENNLVRLPYGSPYTQNKIDVFCDELVGFPKFLHDDSVASFSHGLAALKKVGNTYVVAVGDKVLDYMGNPLDEKIATSPVASVLDELGLGGHEDDDLDEDDPMTGRFSGLLD